jgi:hypothetical protein
MSEYSMPTTALGDIVLFYPHEGAKPTPAVVTAAASRTVTLWLLSGSGSERPSVHHLTDPGVHEFPDWKRYGFWEARPKDPQISILSEKVALLESKVGGKKG